MKYKDEEIDYALWQVLRGNKSAFLIIYNTYYRMAVSILRRALRSSEVDEAVNKAFLMVYKGLKTSNGSLNYPPTYTASF